MVSRHRGRTTRPDHISAVHLFSVDLEDWYHVSAFEPHVPRSHWPEMPSRVVASSYVLLDLLSEAGHSATFFVLGWVAERQPSLIRELVARGHEVASHTWWHRRVFSQDVREFQAEVTDTRHRLEDIGGAAVTGFRAPSFSITPEASWAFEALVEAGYEYDSSVFPIRRPGYGYPGAPLAPYVIDTPSGPLREYPLATVSFGGMRLPAAGGAYLRHLPSGLVDTAIRQAEAASRPAMLYVHPWEVDPGQPRIAVGRVTRLRHYGGLARMAPRLQRILGQHTFTSVQKWESAHLPVAVG